MYSTSPYWSSTQRSSEGQNVSCGPDLTALRMGFLPTQCHGEC